VLLLLLLLVLLEVIRNLRRQTAEDVYGSACANCHDIDSTSYVCVWPRHGFDSGGKHQVKVTLSQTSVTI
jgi:hypothetical protein